MFTVIFKEICEGIHVQIITKPGDDDIANSAALLLCSLSHDKLRDQGVIYQSRVLLTRSNAPRVRFTHTRVDNDQFSPTFHAASVG